ncbi:unnamed protein product, partial [Choristocarpus tenellus]
NLQPSQQTLRRMRNGTRQTCLEWIEDSLRPALMSLDPMEAEAAAWAVLALLQLSELRVLRKTLGPEVALAFLRVVPAGQATPYPLAARLHVGQQEAVAGAVIALQVSAPTSLSALVHLPLSYARYFPCSSQRIVVLCDIFFLLIVQSSCWRAAGGDGR